MNIYILYPDGDYTDDMIKQLSLRREFVGISSKLSILKRVIRKISKLLKINLSSIYLNKKLSKIKDTNETQIIIFDIFWSQEIDYLNKKFPKSKVKIWYWNQITSKDNIDYLKMKNRVYTFNKIDSVKYKINYIDQFYWNTQEEMEANIEKQKVYCLALNKKRYEFIERIYIKLKKLGVDSEFYIVKDSNEKSKILDLKKKFLSYSENVEKIKENNCILEIVRDNQTGLTLRTLEALFFKKKLITNNKEIKKYDFYKPENILYIESEEDITMNFFMVPKVDVSKYIDKYKIETWFDKITVLN